MAGNVRLVVELFTDPTMSPRFIAADLRRVIVEALDMSEFADVHISTKGLKVRPMTRKDNVPKSQEHHLGMASNYLYNAVRSLAASEDKLAGFKEWAKTASIADYQAAIAMHVSVGRWPWEKEPTTD